MSLGTLLLLQRTLNVVVNVTALGNIDNTLSTTIFGFDISDFEGELQLGNAQLNDLGTDLHLVGTPSAGHAAAGSTALLLTHSGEANNIAAHAVGENRPKVPSRGSKHSKTEKYLCRFPECNRSKAGSGFKRKDKCDDHQERVHGVTAKKGCGGRLA